VKTKVIKNEIKRAIALENTQKSISLKKLLKKMNLFLRDGSDISKICCPLKMKFDV